MAGEIEEKEARSKSGVKPLAIVLVVIGVLLLAVGIIYLTVSAPNLPGFIPGKPSYKVVHARHYTKRGIAALILAGIAFIGAWYASGMRQRMVRGH
jgi:hypothetical protein